jgi:hypothetical protein
MTTLHPVANDPEPPGFARRNLLRGAVVGIMTAAVPVAVVGLGSFSSFYESYSYSFS